MAPCLRPPQRPQGLDPRCLPFRGPAWGGVSQDRDATAGGQCPAARGPRQPRGPRPLAGGPRASLSPSRRHALTVPSPRQTDVLTCVASTDPGFRAHWLVAALGSVGRFLKAAVSMLLPER